MSRQLRVGKVAGATALVLLATPATLLAHEARSIAPDRIWSAWSWEPVVVATLLSTAALYVTGVVRLWRASARGAGLRTWEAASFFLGWLVLGLALVSPLHALGGVLFSAHMTQHELLISVAAPLLVLGRPVVAFIWSLPIGWRREVGGIAKADVVRKTWAVVTAPVFAFALHAIALWLWHLPRLYQATLTSELMHSLQHTSFLFSALLFWWTIFAARAGEFRRGLAVFLLFGTVLQTGALGALLTFSGTLWYPAYASTTAPWGLTALDDQQLGGLIMWIPGSIAYVLAALWIAAAWLRESERRVVQRERVMFAVRTIVIALVVGLPLACDRASGNQANLIAGADVDRGRTAIKRYGCGSCHNIPGVTGAAGLVGPPLDDVARRVYIAGVLPNEPDNMIRWIENPPAIDPKTAMPYMGVTTRDARDIAAYLYNLP
ncbi:MAG: cytochrome c oxidase assembly protein [Gemmatimonadaceae bacterium]